LTLHGAAEKFLVPAAIPDGIIKTRWDDLSKIDLRGRKVFVAESWRLYQRAGLYLFVFASPVFGSIPYKAPWVRKDFIEVEILLPRSYLPNLGDPVNPLGYPLDELLFIHFLALGRGAEVHACGIVDSLGRGHLFLGQSEAGKSTMARLWQDQPGVVVLSDDRIILRAMNGNLWMYGTPWHGDAGIASTARAPLKGIYFLEKGLRNELFPQKASIALGRLVSCGFLPFYDRRGLDYTLTFFEKVLEMVPSYELRFLPNKGVIDFIHSHSFT